jgi:hypothetical protein
MTPQAVRKATLTYPSGEKRLLHLMKLSRADFRWIDTGTGKEFDGVSYLEDGPAVRAMRVFVESDPSTVGIDLTIELVDPPPERRAAVVIAKLDKANNNAGWEDAIASIIEAETNVTPMASAFSDLMGYLFIHRAKFALALFPPTPAGQPRDLTMDGLLLNAIEQLAKATKQDFGNLVKILKRPVQQIAVARVVPKEQKLQ